MSFIRELRRRNVIRVAVVYGIVAWVLIQIADTIFPILKIPDWTITLVTVLLLIGFPLALILAWAFELTPEGIKRDRRLAGSESADRPRPKIDYVLIGLMALAILYLLFDDYWAGDTPPQAVERTLDSAAPADQRILLAVLPLDNLSGDPDQEYFSDGLTELLIAQLGNLQRERLGVIGRTSAMYYKDKNKRIDEIGAELGVDFVLEGSVQRADKRVRITAQLVQVSDQTQLWADTYERDIDSLFALQSDVSERVTRTLALELLPEEQAQLQEPRPANAKAYDAFLRGRYYESIGGPNALTTAIEHYSEAVQADPGFALAYAHLGHAYGMRGARGFAPPDEANQKMWDYNLKAAELDPGLAEVEVNFADFKFYQDWDWSAGETGFRRAFEQDPGSESVVLHYALALHVLGRYGEAIDLLKRALELDPFSLEINRSLVAAYLNSRQDERAIRVYQKLVALQPEAASAHNALATVYHELGRFDDAVEAYLTARTLAGDESEAVQALREAYRSSGMLGYWRTRVDQVTAMGETLPYLLFARVYATLGESDQALDWVEQAVQRQEDSSLNIARVYAVAGDKDRAIEWLERAYSERQVLLPWINVDRDWDALRDDPRFEDLIHRMKFPRQ